MENIKKKLDSLKGLTPVIERMSNIVDEVERLEKLLPELTKKETDLVKSIKDKSSELTSLTERIESEQERARSNRTEFSKESSKLNEQRALDKKKFIADMASLKEETISEHEKLKDGLNKEINGLVFLRDQESEKLGNIKEQIRKLKSSFN